MSTIQQPAPSSDNLLLGKGDLFFRRKDSTNQGLLHLGNVETFEITTADDVVEKYSSMDAAAPLYKRVSRRRTVTLRVAADEFHADNVAMMLMGDKVQSAAQVATPVVGESLTTNVLKGGYYKFSKFGPHTGIVIKQGATTLVLGTDYTVFDSVLGIIRILPTSVTVTAGSAITADYTPTAYSSGVTQVRGGTKATIEGDMLFVGDPATGPKLMVEVWSVSINPDGAIGLISDDFAQMALTAAVQSDAVNHPTEPLYRVTYLPA